MAKFLRSNLEIGQDVTSQSQQVPVFRYQGTGQGPSVYIQAGVHGAELQGNAAIFHLMQRLERVDVWGDITIVPHANPIGLNHKMGEFTYGRFDPMSGHNWNRLYWCATYQEEHAKQDEFQIDVTAFAKRHLNHPSADVTTAFHKACRHALDHFRLQGRHWGRHRGNTLATALQTMAFEADIVLDLHTASRAVRYVYSPEYAAENARYLGMPYQILIPNQFSGALDEAVVCPWWDLAEAFAKLGRAPWRPPVEAFTLELGGQESVSLDEAEKDSEGILNYLRFKGVISGSPSEPTLTTDALLRDVRPFFAPKGGLIEFLVAPGEIFKKDQIIAKILNLHNLHNDKEWGDAIEEVRAPDAGVILSHCSSAAVPRGSEICQIMIVK